MQDSQGKKIFRVHLSISVVLILLTLSTLSLFAAFYLGMIAGKSMQRPPEKTIKGEDLFLENPMSEDDLKFFGLGERKKDQDLLDLEEIRELQSKTEELTKIPRKNKVIQPKISKTEVPKEVAPESLNTDKKNLNKTKIKVPKLSPSKNISSEIVTDLEKKKDSKYTIQVFASRNHKNAKIFVEKLKKDGFNNAFIFKHSAGSKTLFRVRVGKVKRNETKILSEKLKKLKYIDSVQVTRF